MKTPKDIKAGLKVCATTEKCEDCPYDNDCKWNNGFHPIASDALCYISMLELLVPEKVWNKICELNGGEI